MSMTDRIKAAGQKHILLGIISQFIVTVVAIAVALAEGFVVFVAGMVMFFPMGKYGPPPTPTPDIIVKYGAPVPPDSFLSGLATPEGVAGILVVLASLALYAWTLIGWVFWGSMLYIRMKEKK